MRGAAGHPCGGVGYSGPADPDSPEGYHWGVIDAAYVRADGSAGIPPNPLQYALFDDFGPNVHTQGGQRMLGLSSGYARLPIQAGACGSNSWSQSNARSNRLIRLNGCSVESATMPTLVLPEPSGMNHTQYPFPIK